MYSNTYIDTYTSLDYITELFQSHLDGPKRLLSSKISVLKNDIMHDNSDVAQKQESIDVIINHDIFIKSSWLSHSPNYYHQQTKQTHILEKISI